MAFLWNPQIVLTRMHGRKKQVDTIISKNQAQHIKIIIHSNNHTVIATVLNALKHCYPK